MVAAVCEIVELSTNALTNNDLESAKLVEPLEQVIDRLKLKIKASHIQRLKDGDCTVEYGFILSDILTNCERISDHCSNIAVYTMQLSSDKLDAHKYLNKIKSTSNETFMDEFDKYSVKYSI
jgi:phosphate:Na+ symporter